MTGNARPLLEVRDLAVAFATPDGTAAAVNGVDFEIHAGRTLGLVGESGSGKSVTALAVMGLVAPPGRVVAGSVRLEGRELVGLDETALAAVRGDRLAMVFQEPMTSLNPVFTVGEQIAEVYRIHRRMAAAAARREAVEMLRRVGIAAPEARARAYPHQLSGGMRQRVMIAIALACRPAVLIADEPTTALDVTVQAEILELILDLQREMGMGVLFISHDMAVVSEIADEVAVMYAGRIVERAPAAALFDDPRHPYTRALIAAIPRLDAPEDGGRDGPGAAAAAGNGIPGEVPSPFALPPGCAFAPRCPLADDGCRRAVPPLDPVGEGRRVACFRAGA